MKRRRNKKLDDPLKVRDPISHWCGQASKLALQLGLGPGEIERAVNSIVKHFGRDWIESAFHRRKRGQTWDESQSWLLSAMEVAGENQVALLTEAGTYLLQFENTPGLDSVVDALRIDSDEVFMARSELPSAFTQLAFAYRLSRIGLAILEFEPRSTGLRLADIRASNGSMETLVECYCPRRVAPDSSAELRFIIEDVDQAILHSGCVMRVQIRVQKAIDAATRKAIKSELLQMVTAVGCPGEVSRDLPSALLRVECLGAWSEAGDLLPPIKHPSIDDPELDSYPSVVIASSQVPLREARAISDGHIQGRPDHGRIEIWRLPSDRDAEPSERFSERIADKVASKASQTRSTGGAPYERLVFVDVGSNFWLSENRDLLVGRIEALELNRRTPQWQ